jgi:hypothetical protein
MIKSLLKNVFISALFFAISNNELKAQSFKLYRGDTINLIDSNGLSYGRWLYPKVGKYYKEGKVIIIELNDTSQIKRIRNPYYYDFGDVLLKDDSRIFFLNRYENIFSVPDGVWIEFDFSDHDGYKRDPNYSSGGNMNITSISYYNKGQKLSTKEVKNGKYIEYRGINSLNEDKVLDVYYMIDTLPTQRTNFNKNTPDELPKTNCYPDYELNFSQCHIRRNNSNLKQDTFNIKIYSNSINDIKIKEIISSTANLYVQIGRQVIQPNDSINLKIIYDGRFIKGFYSELLTLKTSQNNYYVYLDFYKYDIGWDNLETLKTIYVSKSDCIEDNIVFGPKCGHNYMFLFKEKMNIPISSETHYLTWFKESKPLLETRLDDTGGYGKFDLTDIPIGTYYLYYNACWDQVYEIKVIVNE